MHTAEIQKSLRWRRQSQKLENGGTWRGSGRVPQRGFIGQYLFGSGNGFQKHDGDA
jgi:hypothetical protein